MVEDYYSDIKSVLLAEKWTHNKTPYKTKVNVVFDGDEAEVEFKKEGIMISEESDILIRLITHQDGTPIWFDTSTIIEIKDPQTVRVKLNKATSHMPSLT